MSLSATYKNKTKAIEKLEKEGLLKPLEKKGLMNKLFSSQKEYADIYFHSGALDEEALNNILNSKKTIVSSKSLKKELIKNSKIETSKIEVVYPSVNAAYDKTKDAKKRVCEKLKIDNKRRIILYTAKNLKTSGLKEFIETIFSLNEQNFYGIIAGDEKQIYNLKFQLSKFNYSDKLLLVEDYENMDDLFLASDIFLLPTAHKTFSANILKAMFCKCAVFTTVNNYASELIDVFATLDGPGDRSTGFKLDALLLQKEELKKIKKTNRKIAKEFTLENNLKKLRQIIESV